MIKDKLPDWLDTGRAKLLHDVTLPAPYNAQIDAILIDTSGIYVIECKCWDRLIVGKYDWPYWFRDEQNAWKIQGIVGREKTGKRNISKTPQQTDAATKQRPKVKYTEI